MSCVRLAALKVLAASPLLLMLGCPAFGIVGDESADGGSGQDASHEICDGSAHDAFCGVGADCNCWAPNEPCCDNGLFCHVESWCNVEEEDGCSTLGVCVQKRAVGEECELSSDCLDESAHCGGDPRKCMIVEDFCSESGDPCVQDGDCCSNSCQGFSGFQPGYCG